MRNGRPLRLQEFSRLKKKPAKPAAMPSDRGASDRARRRRQPDVTRRRLLDAGSAEFARKGFDGATLDTIAKRARVNKAMIAYHFKDKRGLYRAILEEIVGLVVTKVGERLPDRGSPRERLRAYIGILSEAMESHPDFSAMLLREYLSGWFAGERTLVERLQTLFQLTRAELAKGVAAGRFREFDPHALHLIIVGAIVYFQATRSFRGDAGRRGTLNLAAPEAQAFVSQLADLCLDGLAVDGDVTNQPVD
jgi:AcrR family transcriptional regulator